MLRSCEPTDDLGLSDEFLADECVARDEDNYGRERRCTCGFRAAAEDAQYYRVTKEEMQHLWDSFPGCRGCDPVDAECKPYGWGIEKFEQEAMLNRARQLKHWWSPAVSVEPIDWEYAKTLAFRWSGFDYALLRMSERVWDGLCDCCETHREALAKYAAWCKRRGLTKKAKR